MEHPPEPTPPPRFEARGQGQQFIGWTSVGSTWEEIECPSGETMTQSSLYFACASLGVTSFGIATTCISGSILPNPSSVFTCPGPCCTNALYLSDLSDPSPYHAYACGVCISTLFRETPTSTSSTSSQSPTSFQSSTSIPTTLSSIPYVSTLSSTNTLSYSSSASSSESQDTHASSESWIAGAVVGPVVALAIIATLAFWIWKLQRQQLNVKEQVIRYDTTGKAELDPNSHPAIINEVHEQPLVEMPGSGGFPELPENRMR